MVLILYTSYSHATCGNSLKRTYYGRWLQKKVYLKNFSFSFAHSFLTYTKCCEWEGKDVEFNGGKHKQRKKNEVKDER